MKNTSNSEPDTSASLLERLGNPPIAGSEADWSRFVDLYAPLVYHWGCQHRLQPADSMDLVQDVMVAFHRLLPHFQYDPNQRFRGYLHGVTKRISAQRSRRARPGQVDQAFLQEVADESPENQPDCLDQREYDAYVSKRSLKLIQSEFAENDWRACWMTLVEGHSVADVCRELGMTANKVYLARSRVLARLRSELRDLLG